MISRVLCSVVCDAKVRTSYSFAKGVTCGMFCFDDNIAWLSGNLVAGFLGFKSVLTAEWVNAGLNVLALIPVLGDSGKVAAKVTKFVNRVPKRFNDVTRTVATWNRLPDRVKTAALRSLLPLRYGKLRDAGFSDDVIQRLARGQRTDLRVLADAASSSLRRPAGNIGFRSSGQLGEQAVRNQLGLNVGRRVYLSRVPPRYRVPPSGSPTAPCATTRSRPAAPTGSTTSCSARRTAG